MSEQTFITSGDIARMMGCPLHRVTYALQRLQIKEDARAGAYLLFESTRASEIITAIESIGLQCGENHSPADRGGAAGGTI
ncbi:MAG: hypothetical protein O7D91_09320 [Planctomycetota bacterium]|nr:hypothetical protein [Planctomycetota bacterium]